ncbi:conserved hypothetical protein [Candida dubliniensis CD36]|uniref:Uncharacterized protein n=1 Tax=Candida dubliniensis (strain CD36 / ATCC MYA-646 / CBS 7987 / NCPF 3949 / NRRL Y-17841) TaxID=573826 RepID=B9W9K5_CANDC|nr:conserved hypothetical protein [Candida dubliniensis CD36]CAX45489.1 conserved hypothetical protein [Candida dubliniensis CD36]
MTNTNPDFYSARQVLLLAQLLHSDNINNVDKLTSLSENKIQNIITQWKQHKINHLNSATINNKDSAIKLQTNAQLVELYKNLLKKYEVNNTEELANAAYFKRINELKDIIEKDKQIFEETLTS